MHMLTIPAARHSYPSCPVDLFETDNPPRLVRGLTSSPGNFMNPFLGFYAWPSHHEISSVWTPQPKSKNLSHADFSDSPTMDSAALVPLKGSLSTPPLTSSTMLSCLHSQDSLAPVGIVSAFSPPAASPRITHRTVFTTPDPPDNLVASPLPRISWDKLLAESPEFTLNTPLFQLFKDVDVLSRLEPYCSPVVRRSLGDVTPIYNHRDNPDGRASTERVSPDCVREPLQHDTPGEMDEITISPSQKRKESGTPFLQKLRHRQKSPQNQVFVPPFCTPEQIAPSLASPFSLKTVPTNQSCTQPSSVTPLAAERISTLNSDSSNLKSCRWPKPLHERGLSFSVSSSPLSELSTTPSHSPLPFDLRVLFDEEDRKHRMKTRSAAMRKMSTNSSTLATRKRGLKRSANASSKTDDIASDVQTSPPRKKMKAINEIASPSLRVARWIMSEDAGPSALSAKARSKKIVSASPSSASSSPTSPRPEVYASVSQPSSAATYFQRNLPSSIPINKSFPNFYRKFPIPSHFYPGGARESVLIARGKKSNAPKGHARVNVPRGAYDLYTPRFTKGVGHNKQGLCPICFEPTERSGAGRQEWFSMKFSAYKCYHMQYFHGISPTTGEPFSPPIGFRIHRRTQVRRLEKNEVLEGKCHKCLKWAPVEGVKIGAVNVKELFWWKHAAICHKRSKIPEDTDIFVEDDVFRRLKAYEASSSVINDGVAE